MYCDLGGPGMDGCTATLVDQECDGCTVTLVDQETDQEWMGVQRLWWIRNGWVYCDFGGPGMDGCTATLMDQQWVGIQRL